MKTTACTPSIAPMISCSHSVVGRDVLPVNPTVAAGLDERGMQPADKLFVLSGIRNEDVLHRLRTQSLKLAECGKYSLAGVNCQVDAVQFCGFGPCIAGAAGRRSARSLYGKFTHTRFEPSGWSRNPKIGYAKSIVDYIFRWLELKFITGEQGELFRPVPVPFQLRVSKGEDPVSALGDMIQMGDAPACNICGSLMMRSGTCYRCGTCGSTSGCS